VSFQSRITFGFTRPLEDERILFREGFRGLACSEDAHVSAVVKRTDPDDFAAGPKRVEKDFVPRKNRHDGLPRSPGSHSYDYSFHDSSFPIDLIWRV